MKQATTAINLYFVIETAIVDEPLMLFGKKFILETNIQITVHIKSKPRNYYRITKRLLNVNTTRVAHR